MPDELELSLLPVPEEPDMPEVPELPEEAAGAEDDLALALWPFLCFLAFFFFGVGWLALLSLLAPALEAAGWSGLELAPEVPLGIVLLPAPLGLDMLLPDDVPVPVPEAPDPMVPEAPEVSLLDEGVLGVLGELGVAAEEPDEPDMPEVPEVPDAPLLPAMPASFLFWPLGLDMLLSVLELLPAEVCASTTEDTDATKTSERDRIVFNAMSSSLS